MTDLLSMLDETPDPERFARTSDPSSSKDAAALGDSFGDLTMACLAALAELGEGTRAEVQAVLARDRGWAQVPERGSISRRFTSLMRRGWVRDTGERRDGGRGAPCMVYAATVEGREALR